MILDTLKNASQYKSLDKNLAIGLEYIQNTDFSKLEMGTYKIKGDDVFAMLQTYETKPEVDCRLEAHKKYVDIQFVISGQEYMGVTPLHNQKITEDLPDNDVTFFEGTGNKILIEEGCFTIFYQNDVHAPCIQVLMPEKVIKVVVKVALVN